MFMRNFWMIKANFKQIQLKQKSNRNLLIFVLFNQYLRLIIHNINLSYHNLKMQTQLNNLVNFLFISQYEQIFQETPLRILQNIKALYSSKSAQDNKILLVKQLEQKSNKILAILKSQPINFDELKASTKFTEFNIIVTQLLFSNPKNRKIIQEIRQITLDNLKTPEKICPENFDLLYTIYKNYYFGNQCLTFESLSSPEGVKVLKTILISLKKMITVRSKKSKIKKNKSQTTQPYYVNIDTRNILEKCEIQASNLMEKSLMNKIKQILKEKKKWVGPRIWKIVQENQWTNYQIELFIDLFQNSYNQMQKDQLKSDSKELKKQVQKILTNLRTLLANIHTPQTNIGIEDPQMKQLYSRFQQMQNLNGILFEFKDFEEIEQQNKENSSEQIFKFQRWI